MKPAEAYILKQKEPYRSIMMHLQAVIEHSLSDAELKYKWRLPCFYIGKKPICYINQSKDYVDVGFWHSAHFAKKFDSYLVSENRKIVKSLRYRTLEEVADDVLIAILKEVELHKEKSFWK
ncbi:MAG: 2-dehydro-3-deoxyphosphooctonate aldolase [Xanthomarina sp.]|jgi:hypothetical protein|uniref:Uncharacterized protein n=2 Tax=Xanthomarina gelatinilytica TaxID=1137281 RepID=M7MIG4_9FLAO|nr:MULTISPECIES: DUF1801 domain-containing protein [Xanthomarina]EMQ94876.1 hypothetical protein D778_00236 [Xanthomarina gelatinilytica]MAL23767.1 2-dehydro-3-deoxyphosphooctonate aldolase [Xanthomarina sp.]MBF62227.1 2-dehydro-3-deoxyphosphooctonate aldolase [Xanthomarina sp.]MDX1317279.1 DUF1801 domain-containing protein [Xanthomarina gelatinilytica]HAB26423.1 DUF1801 domain-containing protein [Xanthomarina gelatinilytica]|tara:strand:- start:246 stop:608 length:363 start_codon:yes stop_codon:yes gene_type:complete